MAAVATTPAPFRLNPHAPPIQWVADAVMQENTEALKELLAMGIDATLTSAQLSCLRCNTLLSEAIVYHPTIAWVLLHHGVRATDEDVFTAVNHGTVDLLDAVLSAGGNPNAYVGARSDQAPDDGEVAVFRRHS